MNAEDAGPLDDHFADLLAAYEDALLHGAPPLSGTGPHPPPELRGRIDDALHCVQMLQRLWPAQASPTVDTVPTDRHGTRYRRVRLHATGGVGQVWLAKDADLDREVALKEPRPERADDAAFDRRFLHEARITGRLQHPGIAPVYELVPGADGRPPFYTMRFVRGRTLTEAIHAYHAQPSTGGRPLELNALLNAFVSVCNTVAYAHAQGVIHRDLKSANVVVGDFGEVVLLDWGFAKELGRPEEELPAENWADAVPEQTIAGQVIGTPAYMAPEQAAGQSDRIDRRTDVFGLGAILYEILTGRPPFSGTDTRELIRQARQTVPSPPETVCRAAAPALSAVCMRALARYPADRYGAAADLAREVQRWLADEPTTAYAESASERLRRWGRRHKPLVTGVTALVATGFTALMVGLVLLEREQARTAEIQVQAAAEKAAADAEARDVLESHLYVERLALAERELAAHNLARATQLLAECPLERRGWEWACLQRLCHTDLVILRGHPAPVAGAVFCLGGTRLVSASHDHTLKVWDAETGRELQTLTGHTDVIHCLAVSPDGRRVASGSWDKAVKVWDIETGRELHTLSGHPSIVIRVAFAGNQSLASVSGTMVKLWELNTGRELRRYEKRDESVYGLAISPDGRLLATGEGNNSIRLRDLQSGAEVRVLHGHQSPPKHLAFSPDGQLLAAGDGLTLESAPGTVKLWDVNSGQEVASLDGHTYPVFSVAFSPDGQRLVSGSQDNSIKVWDVPRRQLVLTLRGHADVVRSLTFSPDGNRLASASSDRTVRVWDAAPWGPKLSPGELQPPRRQGDAVLGLAFTERERLVAVGCDGVLTTWDAKGTQPSRTAALHKSQRPFYAFAASPQGNLLALGTSSGAVMLADAETGRELGNCPGIGAGPVKGLAFSNDGRQLAATEWRNTVRIWDVKTRNAVHLLNGHTEPVVAVAFSVDDRLLASGSYDQTVKVWEAATGKEVWTLQGHVSRLSAVAFRPDGQVLASAANDGLIKLWDMRTGRERGTLHGHTAAVGGVAFSPDGRRLASASDDWTVKLWDVAKGEAIATFRGHRGAVRALAFNAEGRRLASGSLDQTVRTWSVAP